MKEARQRCLVRILNGRGVFGASVVLLDKSTAAETSAKVPELVYFS